MGLANGSPKDSDYMDLHLNAIRSMEMEFQEGIGIG